MRPEEGLFDVRRSTLHEIVGMLCNFPNRASGRSFVFGFRKSDGEYAEDVLVIETDGYCEIERLEFEGNHYVVDLTQEMVEDVVGALKNHFPNTKAPNPAIALRYYLEFDAYLMEDTWKFDEADPRPGHRSPADFWRRWMQ